MKKILKKLIPVFTLILGMLIAFTGVYLSVALSSSEIFYDNTNSGLNAITLQTAIDKLYEKAEEVKEQCPTGYVCTLPLINYITSQYSTSSTDLAYDGTTDNNLRYIGSSPKNYIWFNCDDYTNTATCEKWRIIGIMNNVKTSTNSTETNSYVKIIRDERITATNGTSTFSWDYSPTKRSNNKNYSNNWTESELKDMLNSGAYYNNTSQVYYNSSTTTTNIDLTGVGLKNTTTQNMIQSVVWNIGGTSSCNSYASGFYKAERGTATGNPNTYPSVWEGKVGLMYPSDYGYAVGGDVRNKCVDNTKLDSYNKNSCKDNDWLLKSYNQWTLSPNSGYSVYVFYVYYSAYGYVSLDDYGASDLRAVRPSIYLTSDIKKVGGTGDVNDPIQISG